MEPLFALKTWIMTIYASYLNKTIKFNTTREEWRALKNCFTEWSTDTVAVRVAGLLRDHKPLVLLMALKSYLLAIVQAKDACDKSSYHKRATTEKQQRNYEEFYSLSVEVLWWMFRTVSTGSRSTAMKDSVRSLKLSLFNIKWEQTKFPSTTHFVFVW